MTFVANKICSSDFCGGGAKIMAAPPQVFGVGGERHGVSTLATMSNATLLLNCVAQTNTNLLELELNDSETLVSRTMNLICVANS